MDDKCSNPEVVLPQSHQLDFFAETTKYQDDGLYRCRVTLSLQDYNYEVVSTRDLNIERIGRSQMSIGALLFAINYIWD